MKHSLNHVQTKENENADFLTPPSGVGGLYLYMKKNFLLPLYGLTFVFLMAQCCFSQHDSSQFHTIAKNISHNDSLHTIALTFLDTPYVAGTLEVNAEEQLVINWDGMDCTTLVENCLALFRTAQKEEVTLDAFSKELQYVRYRGGEMDGYNSRLHYATDWLFDNVQKGVVEDVTKQLGGEHFPNQVFYMSSNPEHYRQLKENSKLVEEIKQTENLINQRQYYFIPKDKIETIQQNIQNGDILLFTTSIKGLDVSHMAIAYKKDEVQTFIHASTRHKKVIVNPESLVDYCKNIRSNTGIIVLRASENDGKIR